MLQQPVEEAGPADQARMYREKERQEIATVTAKVVQLSEQLLCPLYPNSYEVLYSYCAGTNTKLKEMTDRLIAANDHLTEEHIESIHKETVAPEKKLDEIQLDAGKDISAELQEMSAFVDEYMAANSDYESSLNQSATNLSTVNSQDGLRDLISTLMTENQNMRNQTSELSKSLENSKEKISDLQTRLTDAIEESMKDALTELGNRRWLERGMSEVLETADLTTEEHCVVLIDLDHFKSINDNFGHLVGDKVLRFLGKLLSQNVKGSDTAARYGGEEFAILLRDCKLADAVKLMDVIRTKLESSKMVLSNSKKQIGAVTASFGVTKIVPGDDAEAIFGRADAHLYAAKENGRNQVISD